MREAEVQILNRLGLLIPTFIGVSIIAFSFIRLLPGDPILLLAGERGMTPERYQAEVEKYGFDKPILISYFHWVGKVLTGDLGDSYRYNESVWSIIRSRFPISIGCLSP